LLDVVRPEQSTPPLPVIMMLDPNADRPADSSGPTRLAERGKYVCVRLACWGTVDAADPTSIPECSAAVQWIFANAAPYNMNSDRIGIWYPSVDGDYVYTLRRGSAEVLTRSVLGRDGGSAARPRLPLDDVETFFDRNLRGERPEEALEAHGPGRRGFGGKRQMY
jgi:hypothetical protein